MSAPEDRASPTEGGLAFTELSSADPAATRRFLEQVFGWKFRSVAMPMGEYLSYETPDGRGGVRPVQPAEQPASLAYVRVRDLAAAQRKVESAGAVIVLPTVEVPGMGSFFWFRVPGGPVLACWQDLPAHPTETKEKQR
ncbi:MAG TPA: VOC family protein [Thermoplasmata archaeon]|nr:VOC family protein [Thermoplasmata archaeon]